MKNWGFKYCNSSQIVELRSFVNCWGIESNPGLPDSKSPFFLYSRLPLVSTPLWFIPSDAPVYLGFSSIRRVMSASGQPCSPKPLCDHSTTQNIDLTLQGWENKLVKQLRIRWFPFSNIIWFGGGTTGDSRPLPDHLPTSRGWRKTTGLIGPLCYKISFRSEHRPSFLCSHHCCRHSN